MQPLHRRVSVPAHAGLAVAAVILTLLARPTAAQQPSNAAVQDSTPLTLLYIIFPDEQTAQQAASELTAQGYQAPAAEQPQAAETESVQWIEPYYAIASMDQSGKVTTRTHGNQGSTPRDTRAGQSIDGVAALLNRRATPSNQGAADSGASGAAGGNQAGIAGSDMHKIQSGLKPGESAVILVVAEPTVDGVTSQMQDAHASQVIDAPLLVVTPE